MLGQLRIFERSHLNKVSFELHLPWRVGVTPFYYKTGCTSQSCQNSLITSPWKLLLAFEEVRSYVLSVIPTPRRGTNKITLHWEWSQRRSWSCCGHWSDLQIQNVINKTACNHDGDTAQIEAAKVHEDLKTKAANTRGTPNQLISDSLLSTTVCGSITPRTHLPPLIWLSMIPGRQLVTRSSHTHSRG